MNINNYLNKLGQETNQDPEVLTYGFNTLKQMIIGYVILISFSYILNILIPTLTIAITTSILRMFTGGSHATSKKRCLIIGISVFIFFGFMIIGLQPIMVYEYYIILLFSTLIISLIIIYKYGYATTHKKLLKTYNHGKKLMIISFFIILINCIISLLLLNILINNYIIELIILSINIGILWHVFDLTPIGKNLTIILDKYLHKIIK